MLFQEVVLGSYPLCLPIHLVVEVEVTCLILHSDVVKTRLQVQHTSEPHYHLYSGTIGMSFY